MHQLRFLIDEIYSNGSSPRLELLVSLTVGQRNRRFLVSASFDVSHPIRALNHSFERWISRRMTKKSRENSRLFLDDRSILGVWILLILSRVDFRAEVTNDLT